MLFVKAFKMLSISIVFMPLFGCSLATGFLYGSLLTAVAYSPDHRETLFQYSLTGFALVETFTFMLFFIAAFVFTM